MKKYQTKLVSVEKEVCVEVICDECNKNLNGDFYELMTGHNDWGNDSGDSIEYEHFCSKECLKKFVNKYIDEMTRTNYFTVSKGVK